MNIITISIYSFAVLSTLIACFIAYALKKPIWLVLFSAVMLRFGFIAILESGVKYQFVIDSMKYEQDAWLIAKQWINIQADFRGAIDQTNFYTWFAGSIFYIFGNSPLILTLCNSILGLLATLQLIFILNDIFLQRISDDIREKAAILLACLVSLYPSYIVWITTNTKDPMTIMFINTGLFGVIKSLNHRLNFWSRISLILMSIVSFLVVYQLRAYVFYTIILGSLFGLFYFLCLKKIAHSIIIFTLGFFAIILYNLVVYLNPEIIITSLSKLSEIRLSFSNLGLDDAAQSSFLLNYTFSSIWDLLIFIPKSIGYYLLGPFPWQIANVRQGFALIEPISILLLSPFTFRGIRSCYKLNRLASVIILSIAVTIILAQAITISNLGTLFRHRTFVLMIMALFTSVGFYEKEIKST